MGGLEAPPRNRVKGANQVTYKLIVKGDVPTVVREIGDRIACTIAGCEQAGASVAVRISIDEPLDLEDWFNEPRRVVPGFGYEDGSLLWFGPSAA
jgi:hypothetical protein